MKKGRVTADEKRTRTIEFLMDNKTLFNLKELESKLSKEKGIVSQAVKDLLEELVNDNLIEKDKIGSGNYFWCFPSKAVTIRENQLSKIDTDMEQVRAQLDGLQSRKRKLTADREETAERKEMLSQLFELKRQQKDVDEKLSAFAASDPATMKKLVIAAQKCLESTNRWTDNIHQCVSFFKNRMGEFNYAQFMKHFGLTEELDDLPQFDK